MFKTKTFDPYAMILIHVDNLKTLCKGPLGKAIH